MDNTQLVIVILGIVAGLALIVLAYVARTRRGEHAELLRAMQEIVGPILRTMQEQADKQLAALGPTLLPVHEAIGTMQTLVDEDEDFIVKLITSVTKNNAVIEALRETLKLGEELTDGQHNEPLPEPEQEHLETSQPQESTK